MTFNSVAVGLLLLKPHPIENYAEVWRWFLKFDTDIHREMQVIDYEILYFRLLLLLKHKRKVVGGCFRKKVVLELVQESQEKHVRHQPPWYDLCC